MLHKALLFPFAAHGYEEHRQLSGQNVFLRMLRNAMLPAGVLDAEVWLPQTTRFSIMRLR
jgi:hypothetical protein